MKWPWTKNPARPLTPVERYNKLSELLFAVCAQCNRIGGEVADLRNLLDERTPEGEARVKRILNLRSDDPVKKNKEHEATMRFIRLCDDVDRLVSMVSGIAARQEQTIVMRPRIISKATNGKKGWTVVSGIDPTRSKKKVVGDILKTIYGKLSTTSHDWDNVVAASIDSARPKRTPKKHRQRGPKAKRTGR